MLVRDSICAGEKKGQRWYIQLKEYQMSKQCMHTFDVISEHVRVRLYVRDTKKKNGQKCN